MRLSKTTVLFAILPFGIATSCTDSNAKAWLANNDFSDVKPGSSSVGDSLSDVCANTCGNNSTCITTCLAEDLAGQCAALGCSDDDDSDDLDSLIKKSIEPRATMSCTSSESCYTYTDGSLLCLNLSNGVYALSTLLSILDTCIIEISLKPNIIYFRQLPPR
jgi:hypothetical protein